MTNPHSQMRSQSSFALSGDTYPVRSRGAEPGWWLCSLHNPSKFIHLQVAVKEAHQEPGEQVKAETDTHKKTDQTQTCLPRAPLPCLTFQQGLPLGFLLQDSNYQTILLN